MKIFTSLNLFIKSKYSQLVAYTKRIYVPGLEGMPLYELLEMYSFGIFKGALSSRASGISYSFFMAVFPFLLFILTLIPYIPIDGFQENLMQIFSELLPPKTFDAVSDVLQDIAKNKYGGLMSFGFLTSIILMTNGVNAILGAFEYSIHVEEFRNVIKQYFISMGTSLVMSLLLIITVVVTIVLEFGLAKIEAKGWISTDVAWWLSHLRYLFFTILIFCSVSILNYIGATGNHKKQFFSAGSVLTTILYLLTFYLFGIYVVKFSKYNELYGSIGTLLVLMLFIWINSIILLLGFELNASLNQLKKKHGYFE